MDLTSKQRPSFGGWPIPSIPLSTSARTAWGRIWSSRRTTHWEARELIKCRVLENAMLSPREAADALSRATRSEVVQVIGTKFVLYRQSHNKDKKDRIALVK